MKNSNVAFRATLILLCCASLAYSAQSAKNVLMISDTVVIASRTSYTNRGDGTLVNLSILQWLSTRPSGAPAFLQALEAVPSLSQQQLAPSPPAKPKPAIWFLKSQNDGTYSVVPVRPGKSILWAFPAADRGTCPGALTYPPDAPLTDKIAMELACLAAQDISVPPMAPLAAESMVDGTHGLGTSPRVRDAFLYLAQSPSSRQKAIGIACLIADQDPVGLTLLEQHIQEIAEADLQHIVARTLSPWQNTDPAAIKSLGRIATGPHGTGALLFYASLALSAIHTADTLPYFRLLLDNQDRSIRQRAVGAFGQFVMGAPVHTRENSLTMEFMKSYPTPYASEPLWQQFPHTEPNPTDAELQAVAAFLKKWLSAHPELPQQ